MTTLYSAVGDDKSRKKDLFFEKEEKITYVEEAMTKTILHYSKNLHHFSGQELKNAHFMGKKDKMVEMTGVFIIFLAVFKIK